MNRYTPIVYKLFIITERKILKIQFENLKFNSIYRGCEASSLKVIS